MTLTINVDNKKSIYLDERGDRKPDADPSARGYLGYFFIGGVEIFDKDKDTIISFVRKFKSELYPSRESVEWELKGASNPKFVSDASLTDDENRIRHIDAAKKKWAMWSKALQNEHLPYKIYGSFLKLEDFKKRYPDSGEKDVIKAAFIDVAYKFVNFGCVQRHLDREQNMQFTLLPCRFYFDNVANLQEKAVLEAFEKYPDHYPHIADSFCVDDRLNFITNADYSADDELIMQFVDMQIYAMTRFLSPARGQDGNESNILINFEEYVRVLPQLKDQSLKLTTEELKNMVELHYNIVPIFHDIQNRFHRYGWKDGRQATSLSLIADETYEDFGLEAHVLMQKFGGSLTLPEGVLFNKLNRKPAI